MPDSATGSTQSQGHVTPRVPREGIPDLKWINRSLSIVDVARKLGLRSGDRNMIHCWHPERHQHGDRTPSVSILQKNNSIRCFGCGKKPMSVVDLIMDTRGLTVAEAARWLDENFAVQRIQPGKHLAGAGAQHPYIVGMETPIELLVRSASGRGSPFQHKTDRAGPTLVRRACRARNVSRTDQLPRSDALQWDQIVQQRLAALYANLRRSDGFRRSGNGIV